MPNLNIALSDEQYARLVKYKETKKPHLSMRAIIVEAVEKDLDTTNTTNTQFDESALRNPELAEKLK
ncbi:MAG: hypothetical protein WD492_12660 [Alkalispirochaeta sp.]